VPRLRPRGPEPGLGRRVRVVALPVFPGLGVTATFVPGTAIAAELDAPGLDVTAIPTGYDITASLAFPGLAVAALCRAGTQVAATVAFPGLTTRADFFAALAAMPSLDVPKAIVSGPGLGAQPVFPGLAVPKADVRAIRLVPLAATVDAPGLSVAAAVTPPAGQFRLAPDYTIDWATLRAPIPAPSSVVQIGSPVSTGVQMSGHTAGASGELVGNVALVSRNKSGPGWTGGFTLKRTDAFAPASGGGAAFLILGFGMVGDGTTGRPADVGQWPGGMEPVSTEFRDHTTGARLTFFFNNNALGVDPPASVPSLAVFNADGSVTTIAADGSPAGLNQARNFPFVYTLALSTASPPVLTLTQHDASVPTDRTITWTSALLGTRASPSQGSFVWLCTPGRVAQITAESFTPPATPQPSATVVLPGLDLIPRPQVDVGGGGGGFPNGYAARRLLVRSAQADLTAESTTSLPSFIDTTEIPGDWSFLLTSSGDLLSLDPTTGFPYDIRFMLEDDTTKLDHQVVSYDGTAGTARFFVREPTGSTSGTDLRVLMYYGKAGLGATEENIAGVWRAASLVVDPTTTTGADLTGGGRNLARSGVFLGNTTMDGRPAARVADQTGGFWRRTNPDLLAFDLIGGATNGEATEEFWAKIGTASSGNVARIGGDVSDPAQTYQRARFSSWAEATGTTGGKANVLQVGAQFWTGSSYVGQTTESLAGIADGTTVRHLIIVHKSNTHSQVYDGETNVSSTDYLGTLAAGTLHMRSTDNYSLGAGTGTQNKSPAMTLGLYVLWPKALSATWRAMLDRTQRDSSLCWAVGAEDLPTGDKSPVGEPWRDSINATTVYDLATHAFDPDPGASIVATAVTPNADTLAGYTVPTTGANAGKLVVAPVAGSGSGVGRPVVTLSDGTKTAKVKPYISISGIVTPPSGYYKTPPLPATKIAVTTRAGLVAADALFATAGKSATHYISIEGPVGVGDSTTGSPLRLVGGGTRAAPYVITSPGAGSDAWSGRSGFKIYNTQIEFSKPWTWVYGVWTSIIPVGAGNYNCPESASHAYAASASDCFITACRMTGSKGVREQAGVNHTDRLTINFNWFEMIFQATTSVGGGTVHGDMCINSEEGAVSGKDWIIARNRTSDGPGAYGITGAGGPKNARFVYTSPGQAFLDWVVEYNFMDAGHSHYIEFKTGIKTVKWNHGTGTNNVYGGIYYRGNSPGGGEISYNRIKCVLTNMNSGANVKMVSNWYVDGAGAISGKFSLAPHGTRIGDGNDIQGCDGLTMVGCKANLVMPDLSFEPPNYNYDSLGAHGNVLLADHAGSIVDSTGGNITFNATTGHPQGTYTKLVNSAITKQANVPPGFTEQVPPILNATVCGPGAPGLSWP
jgi:hypothetical protein